MSATVDLSKIPSPCTFQLSSGCNTSRGSFCCSLEELVRGKSIKAHGWGHTPQEAVDEAIKNFTT